jgi:hypothetical protein
MRFGVADSLVTNPTACRLYYRHGAMPDSRDMHSDLDRWYGVAADDPQVEEGVAGLKEYAPAVLRSVLQALYAYERTQDVETLKQLARDLLASARLHADPQVEKAFKAAPTAPVGVTRPVDEVFARLGM